MNLKSKSLLSKRAFQALLTSLAIAMPMAAQAASFVVEEGQVVGGQTLSSLNDTGFIELGGTIETSTAIGVNMANGLQTLTNDGTILTTGGGGGLAGVGVAVFGPGSLATNNGLIQTQGAAAFGIYVHSTAFNPLTGTGAFVVNNGHITTSGTGASGIISIATSTSITNNGEIRTSGASAAGIVASGASASINNTGLIVSAAAGISAVGANASVTNSGTVIASNPAGAAFSFSGANPTLNLQRGSNIQGRVALTQAGTLNVQKGLNLALTTTGNVFTTITTQGAPFATSGNLVAVVDRTGFAMEVDILDDLTAVIMNNLGSQYCFDCNDCCDVYGFNNDWKGWVRGFGSYRQRKLQHRTVEYYNGLEGGMAGVEMPVFCDWTLGLFGGGSYGDAHVKHHTHVLKNTSGFGGLYLDGDVCGNFVRFAISGGSLNQRSRRKVMNNTVEGGYEFAKTKLNGGFVAPELRLGREFCLLGFDLIASADVRYSGLFLDGYNEKGSETNFRVKSHDLHIITTSTELAVPMSFEACGNCMTVTPYVGIEGRYRLGDKKLHGELLDQSITFFDGSWNDVGIAFVGIRSCHNTDCGLSLMLDLEADFDNKKSSLIRGGLKAEMAF
jgi:hypothetical protein